MLFAADNGRNARYTRASSSISRALENVRRLQLANRTAAVQRPREPDTLRRDAMRIRPSHRSSHSGAADNLWRHFLSNARALIAMRHLDDCTARVRRRKQHCAQSVPASAQEMRGSLSHLELTKKVKTSRHPANAFHTNAPLKRCVRRRATTSPNLRILRFFFSIWFIFLLYAYEPVGAPPYRGQSARDVKYPEINTQCLFEDPANYAVGIPPGAAAH